MKTSLNIIVITEDYPPASGGIAQWAYGIVQELIAFGHNVTVLTRASIFKIESFNYSGETIVRMKSEKWSKYRSIYIAYYLSKEVFKRKPDVVIASAWNIGAFATSIKSLFGFKTVLAYHGLEVTKKLSLKRTAKLTRAIKRSDLNIAVSHFTKQQIVDKFNLKEDRISVIHNGVNLDRFYPEAKKTTLVQKYKLENKFVLMTLSRVIERKGHDVVIKSLKKVLERIPNLVYVIAGVYEENFYKQLNELIHELKLENHVIFTGGIPSEEIIDHYNLCDAYIMVSKGSGTKGDSEGFGITYLEANACLKPVIGSNTDGIPDAVEHNVNGLLVEPEDVDETAEAIIKLATNKELMDQLGKNGLNRIHEKFTWKKITEQIVRSI